jgi:uncharacterized membrane protein YagU involved in acid resistance
MPWSFSSAKEKQMNQQENNTATQGSQTWLIGALAGFLATIPMTIFMLITQPFLPKGQRYDLPPEIITKELAHRMHVRHHMSKAQILATTLVSHFGYGATMGVLYSPLGQRTSSTAPVQGSLFGLFVWAASYLGLLPLLGMSESGHNEPKHRNLMMIAAHLIWGAALGGATAVLKNQHPEERHS